jgi:hypothetical protein
VIDPAGNGECIVDIPYSVSAGEKLVVKAGKKLRVNGKLTLLK